MPESEEQRVERALKLAEARVKRDTTVDSRLDGHDRRLALINGQLERGAKATELLAERILRLDGAIDELRGDLKTKGAVDEALRKQADRTLKQQVTRREFWVGVAIVVVAIFSVAVNSGLI